MNEEINKILETLAAKYGTTVMALMQEIIRRGIVLSIVQLVFVSLVLGLAIVATIYCIKKHIEDPLEDWDALATLMGVFAIILGFIWFIILTKLVCWIVSPNAQAITTILHIINH